MDRQSRPSTEADVDGVLDRVREYRRAARRIVAAEASIQRRCLGLLELQDAARSEPDLTIRTWAERSIWEESKAFLGVDDRDPVAPPRSFEAAQRHLRNRGLDRCPTCHARLATDDDFARWSRIRLADAEQRDAHTKAVGR